MNSLKRTTVTFDLELYEAMRLRAAIQNRSMSRFVNEAVRVFLAEEMADPSAITEQLDAVYRAPGSNKGLDPVLADLQSTTLAKHSGR